MGGLILNIEPSPGIILQIFQSTPITISFKPTKSSYVRVTIPPRQKVPGFQGWRVGQKLPRRILRIRNKPFFFQESLGCPLPGPLTCQLEWSESEGLESGGLSSKMNSWFIISPTFGGWGINPKESLVGGWTTPLKNMSQNGFIFPKYCWK